MSTATPPPATVAVDKSDLFLGRLHRVRWFGFAALLAVLAVVGLWPRLRQTFPSSSRVMLVVLPFENLSRDPEQEFFSDGMTEEIITELGSLDAQRLGVIARTSSMQYKGARKSTAQIAHELGVNYLLEGSVRRQGSRVRVTAQLIQASDQTHLWASSFDREQSDILRIQSDVALAIAKKIELSLPLRVQERLTDQRAVDPQAHEAFLLGLQAESRRTRPSVERAIEEFERATAIDSNYAQAYAALARVYSLAPVSGALSALEAMPKARHAALRAIALDDSLAGGHTTLAFVKAHYEFDWPGAQREYLRGLELNPNDAYAHFFYSNSYLSPQGRHAEAIAEIKTAIAIDPLSAPIQSFLIRTYIWARKYDEALEQFQKCNQMFPDFAIDHERAAHLFTYLENFDQAIPEETKARLLAGEDPRVALDKEDKLRQAWQSGGSAGYWRKSLEFASLPQNPPEAYTPVYGVAILSARLGDKEKAVDALVKAYDQRELAMTEIGVEPALDSLRSDVRFQDLLRRVRLTQ